MGTNMIIGPCVGSITQGALLNPLPDVAYTFSNLATDPVKVLFDNKIKFSSDQLQGGVFVDTGGNSRNATPSLSPSFTVDSNGVANGAMITDATHYPLLNIGSWITTQSFCIRIKWYQSDLDSIKMLYSSYATANTEYIRLRALTTGLIDFACKKGGVTTVNLTCDNYAGNKFTTGWNDVIVCVDKVNLTGAIYLNGKRLSLGFNTVQNSDISLTNPVSGVMFNINTGQVGYLEKFEVYDHIISNTAAYNIYLGVNDSRYFNNTGGKLQVTNGDYATAKANTLLDPFDKGIAGNITDYQYTFDQFYTFLKDNNIVFAEPIKDDKIQLSGYKNITTYQTALTVKQQFTARTNLNAHPKKWGVHRVGNLLKIVGQHSDAKNLYLWFGNGIILNDTQVFIKGGLIPKMENDSLTANRYVINDDGTTYPDLTALPGSNIINDSYEWAGPVSVNIGGTGWWVSGHHGNDTTGYKSAKTITRSYKLDGVEIIEDTPLEGNVIEIDVYNEVQNPFTQTGDYVGVVRLLEHINYKLINGNIIQTTEWNGVSNTEDGDLFVGRFYGLQHDHDYWASPLPFAKGQNTKVYIPHSPDVSIKETPFINPVGAEIINGGNAVDYPDVDKMILSNTDMSISSSLWMDNTFGCFKKADRTYWIGEAINQCFVQPRNPGWKNYLWALSKVLTVNDDLNFKIKGGINIFNQLTDGNGNALNATFAYIQQEENATYLVVDYLTAQTDLIKIPSDIVVTSTVVDCPEGTITVNSVTENIISITATGYGSAKIKLL